MDVCTLVIASSMTLRACFAAPVCTEIAGVKYCSGNAPISCPTPPFFYSCVKETGETYYRSQDGSSLPSYTTPHAKPQEPRP